MSEAENGRRPKLQQLWDIIFLWKLVIKKKKWRKVSSRLLRRTSKKSGIYNLVAASLEQAIAAEASAIKALRAGKRGGSKWCKEHNTTLDDVHYAEKRVKVLYDK
jgi:hypothetical protein